MQTTTIDSLTKLIALEKDTREFGFEWTNREMIVEQAISECQEILQAIRDKEPNHRVQEEIGDLLHTAISLCLFANFDVDETISMVNKKFAKRMQAMKVLTKDKGLDNLCGQQIDFMMSLWQQVKKEE